MVNKRKKIKTSKQNTKLGRAYICTPDGHRQPGPWTDAEGFFFPGTVTFTPTCIRPLRGNACTDLENVDFEPVLVPIWLYEA